MDVPGTDVGLQAGEEVQPQANATPAPGSTRDRERSIMRPLLLRKAGYIEAAQRAVGLDKLGSLHLKYLKSLVADDQIGEVEGRDLIPPHYDEDQVAYLVQAIPADVDIYGRRELKRSRFRHELEQYEAPHWFYVDTEGAGYPRYLIGLKPEAVQAIGLERAPEVPTSDQPIEIGVNDSVQSMARLLLHQVLSECDDSRPRRYAFHASGKFGNKPGRKRETPEYKQWRGSRSRKMAEGAMKSLLQAKVDQVISFVEQHLGDVVEDPENEEEVRENTWTLAHDAATRICNSDSQFDALCDATALAKYAVDQMGYSAEYEAGKDDEDDEREAVWPPQPAGPQRTISLDRLRPPSEQA